MKMTMPGNRKAAPGTDFTIDVSANTIRFLRHLNAPPPVIFDAWTRPEQVSIWWDPTGMPLSECTIDLRVGGSFKFVAKDHPEMPFGGVYRTIERPYRLEFEAMAANGRVVFEAAGEGTRITVEIECGSPEHLAQYLKMGVETGTAKTLDNLVAYVKQRS